MYIWSENVRISASHCSQRATTCAPRLVNTRPALFGCCSASPILTPTEFLQSRPVVWRDGDGWLYNAMHATECDHRSVVDSRQGGFGEVNGIVLVAASRSSPSSSPPHRPDSDTPRENPSHDTGHPCWLCHTSRARPVPARSSNRRARPYLPPARSLCASAGP